jgi:hypothetical protein
MERDVRKNPGLEPGKMYSFKWAGGQGHDKKMHISKTLIYERHIKSTAQGGFELFRSKEPTKWKETFTVRQLMDFEIEAVEE